MNNEELFEKFAHIYINGSACDGCKNSPNTCDSNYAECAKRLKEVIYEKK